MSSDIYKLPETHKTETPAISQNAAVGSYDGAVDSRFRQQQAFRRAFEGTEEHALPMYDRQRLILEGMDLERNNEVVAGLIERFPAYAVHTGMKPIPLTADKDWNKTASDWWVQVYAPTCDYRGLTDLDELQRLAVRSRMIIGDCAFLPLPDGTIQPIEGQRICTPMQKATDPTVRDGIQFRKGVAIGAYICPRTDGGSIDRSKYEYREFSKGFFHCWKPKRFDQIRGVPDLAPLINKLRDIDETDGALLRKVKNESRQFMQFLSQESHTTPGNFGTLYSTETDADGNKEGFVKTKEGMVWMNPKGRKLEMVEGKSPNSQVVNYLEWQLKIASACMNIPYAFMALIFENSYTAARAASMHAEHTFTGVNNWLSKRMMSPLWRWRIAMAINRGELPPAPTVNGRSQWDRVEWSVPFMGSLDREKNSRAIINEIEVGTESVTTTLRAMNRSRHDVWETREEELRDAATRAGKLNEEFKDSGFKFTPQDFTNSAQPGGRSATPAETQPETPESETDEDMEE